MGGIQILTPKKHPTKLQKQNKIYQLPNPLRRHIKTKISKMPVATNQSSAILIYNIENEEIQGTFGIILKIFHENEKKKKFGAGKLQTLIRFMLNSIHPYSMHNLNHQWEVSTTVFILFGKKAKGQPHWFPKSPSKYYIVGGIMLATSHNPVEDFIFSVGTQKNQWFYLLEM